MAISVKKAKKKKEKEDKLQTWKVFMGLCKFFSLTHNDIYHLLKAEVDIDEYYNDFIHFRYTLVNNPIALMNKKDIEKVVIEAMNDLRSDVFSVMADPSSYNKTRNSWESLIRNQ